MKTVLKEHSSVIYLRLIKLYQSVAFVFQLNILKPDFKRGAMLFFDFVLLFHYFSSTVYTVVTKWDSKVDVLRALCLEGINVQLTGKIGICSYYCKELYALSMEVLAVHKDSEGPYQDVMYKWTRNAEILAKIQLVIYMFTGITFCLYPLFIYLMVHERTLIYDILLPLDITTTSGYSISIVFQVFVSYGSLVGIYVVDLLFMMMIFTCVAHIDMLNCDCKILSIEIEKLQNLNEINEDNVVDVKDNGIIDRGIEFVEIETVDGDNGISDENNGIFYEDNGKFQQNLKIHNILIRAIKRSQEIQEFFSTMCDIFERIVLVNTYSCAATIILSVFVAKISDWFVVYLLGVSGCYQLSLYCIYGSFIEYKCEEAEKSIYDIPWYDLTKSDQHMLKLLLLQIQNTLTIAVFGERKLNVQTGCDVYNTIYSVYLMLEQLY